MKDSDTYIKEGITHLLVFAWLLYLCSTFMFACVYWQAEAGCPQWGEIGGYKRGCRGGECISSRSEPTAALSVQKATH